MSLFASSSRVTLASLPSPTAIFTRSVSGAHRYVKRAPDKPKLPKIRSPYALDPRTIHSYDPDDPTSLLGPDHEGTPQENQRKLRLSPPSTSTLLQDSSLRLHHSPPASAPSYTTGNVPDLISWVGGNSVKLSGEEQAPIARKAKPYVGDLSRELEQDVPLVEEIKRLRSIGLSRMKIVKRLGLPAESKAVISSIASESPEFAEKRERELEAEKSLWSYKKRLAREVRARRREFW